MLGWDSRLIHLTFWLAATVIAYNQLLPIDGAVNEITGYPGLTYQAVRYEPLCGNLGDDDRYSEPIDMSNNCIPAMEVFGNNTVDTLAFYDTTGVRLKGAIVGNGYPLCMCFAVGQVVSTAIKGGICLYVDGTGSVPVWWSIAYDDMLAGSYRPNIAKALPQCASVDLDQLKSSWSATAVQPSVTEVVSTVDNGGPVSNAGLTTSMSTVISVETFTPSVVNYTTIQTLTTTDSSGSLTTQTSTYTTQLPVVTIPPDDSGELSRSDCIAIGVGLGVGLPTVILALIAVCQQWRRRL